MAALTAGAPALLQPGCAPHPAAHAAHTSAVATGDSSRHQQHHTQHTHSRSPGCHCNRHGRPRPLNALCGRVAKWAPLTWTACASPAVHVLLPWHQGFCTQSTRLQPARHEHLHMLHRPAGAPGSHAQPCHALRPAQLEARHIPGHAFHHPAAAARLAAHHPSISCCCRPGGVPVV